MILVVHTKPNAKSTKVIARLDDRAFAIAVHAPATEGKANEELVEFISDKLDLAKTFIKLKRGHNSRVKHFEIPDATPLDSLTGS